MLNIASKANSPAEEGLADPVKVQLDRLATQVYGLQQQLDAFIARRDQAVAQRASQHVASIVAAAEKSAAEIRAAAEKDADGIRERLLADVHAEVEGIRSEAQADAARVRADGRLHAAHARASAITEASAEIQAVCARLAEELQAGASQAIARIAPREPLALTAVDASPPAPIKRIIDEVDEAVDELRGATAVLEQSLRNVGGEQRRAI